MKESPQLTVMDVDPRGTSSSDITTLVELLHTLTNPRTERDNKDKICLNFMCRAIQMI